MSGIHRIVNEKNTLFVLTMSITLSLFCEDAHASKELDDLTIIVLADKQHPEETNEFKAALETHLAIYGSTLRVHWVPSVEEISIEDVRGFSRIVEEEDVFLVTWCDFTKDKESILYLSQPSEGTVLIRNIGEDDVGVEGRFDALATVIINALEAMSLGAQLGVNEEHSALPILEKLVPDYEQNGASLLLEGAYAIRPLNADVPFTNVGGGAIGVLFLNRWSVALDYMFSRMTVEKSNYVLNAYRRKFGLRGEFIWEKKRLSVSSRLGVDADIVKWHSRITDTDMHDRSERRVVNFGFSASVLFGFRVQPWLRFQTGPGINYWVVNNDYDTKIEGARYVLTVPWDLQPCWIFAATVTVN